jgi:hypothetical protein
MAACGNQDKERFRSGSLHEGKSGFSRISRRIRLMFVGCKQGAYVFLINYETFTSTCSGASCFLLDLLKTIPIPVPTSAGTIHSNPTDEIGRISLMV